jgi:2-oxoisovalerate dehydrogenase E2 component (dihydrolipoyl transacylase)
MGIQSIKLPDVGEGVAEAELVEWHVNVGDPVREDMVLAAVMTGKATVEIPSPVEGEVVWRGGEVGDVIATGTVILKIKVAGDGGDEEAAEAAPPEEPVVADEKPAAVVSADVSEPVRQPEQKSPMPQSTTSSGPPCASGRRRQGSTCGSYPAADPRGASPTTIWIPFSSREVPPR